MNKENKSALLGCVLGIGAAVAAFAGYVAYYQHNERGNAMSLTTQACIEVGGVLVERSKHDYVCYDSNGDYIKSWSSSVVQTALDKLERRKKIKEMGL